MVMSFTKLMRELRTAEGNLNDQKDIHMEIKGCSSFSSQKNKNTTKSTK